MRRALVLALSLVASVAQAGSNSAVKGSSGTGGGSNVIINQNAAAVAWPTNVISVTNHYTDNDCTGLHTAGADTVDACTGFHAASPSLNGFDGADIQFALTQCQAAGGCNLDLGCHTYENAENTISATAPGAGSGRNGIAYTTGFQAGLDISGCGSGTVLKSRAGSTGPGWDNSVPSSNGPTAGIFWTHQWDPAGAPTRGIPKLRYRNFECYGQSDKQPSPETIGGTFLSAQGATFHDCIDGRFDFGDSYEYIEVTGINAHDFEGIGIHVGDSTGRPALVDSNTVTRSGCWQSYDAASVCDQVANPWTSISDTCFDGIQTGCRPACTAQFTCPTCSTVWANGTNVVGEIPCGCNSGQPNCYGWNVAHEINPIATASPGLKINAMCINVEGDGSSTISNNTVSYCSKYGITHNAINKAAPVDSDAGVIANNAVTHSSIGLAQGTHSGRTTITGNRVSAGINGNLANTAVGILSQGRRLYTEVTNNDVTSHGGAILMNGYEASGGHSPNLVVQNNVIHDWGDWSQIQVSPLPYLSGIGFSPNVADAPCALSELQNVTDAIISGNTMVNGPAGYAGISIASGLTLSCPANVMNPLRIFGNNQIGRTTWAAHANDLGNIRAKNITATGITLGGPGTFTWLSGSTGTCSGFTKNGGATVTDSSGNSIGQCP